jgi:uncharacterized protein (DUF58 family)
MHSFIDNDLLSRLGSLPIESRVPMMGNVAGKHRSPHRGSSVEFAEYRKYVPGDDTRRLDWKAFARSDRFYIKEFEADTNLRAYFVVDASGSMKFAGGGEAKIQYARRIAASLAYLLVNQGDAAGLSICTDKLHLEVPPSRRAAHLERFFSTLGKPRTLRRNRPDRRLHTIAEKIGQRAFVVILSDFFTDTAALGDALQHLRYRKHDISVFHLMDPLEIGFEFDRPHRFRRSGGRHRAGGRAHPHRRRIQNRPAGFPHRRPREMPRRLGRLPTRHHRHPARAAAARVPDRPAAKIETLTFHPF